MFEKLKKMWRKFQLQNSDKTNFFIWTKTRVYGNYISFWQKENKCQKLANAMELKMPIVMADVSPPKIKEK